MAKRIGTDIDMVGNRVTGLAAAVASQDAVNLAQLQGYRMNDGATDWVTLSTGVANSTQLLQLTDSGSTSLSMRIFAGIWEADYSFSGVSNVGRIQFAIGAVGTTPFLRILSEAPDRTTVQVGIKYVSGTSMSVAFFTDTVVGVGNTTWKLRRLMGGSGTSPVLGGTKITATMAGSGYDSAIYGVGDAMLADGYRPLTPVSNSPSIGFGLVSGTVGAAKISNDIGEVRIGQASAAWAYYETDAAANYFNKPLEAKNDVKIENDTVSLTTNMSGVTNNTTLRLGCDHRTTMMGSCSRTLAFVAGSVSNPIFTIDTAAGRPPHNVVFLVPGDKCIYQVIIVAAGADAGRVYIGAVLSGTAGLNIYFDGVTFPRA